MRIVKKPTTADEQGNPVLGAVYRAACADCAWATKIHSVDRAVSEASSHTTSNPSGDVRVNSDGYIIEHTVILIRAATLFGLANEIDESQHFHDGLPRVLIIDMAGIRELRQ